MADIKTVSLTLNGFQTWYKTTGHGRDKILLLPGGMGDLETDMHATLSTLNKELFTIYAWMPQAFACENNCFHFDLTRLYQGDADYLADFIREVGLHGCTIIGYCYGGTLALIAAAKYPDLVGKIVTIGSVSYGNEGLLKFLRFARDASNWSHEMKRPHVTVLGEDGFTEFIRKNCDCFIQYYLNHNGYICNNELEKIKCPVLIVHGLKDQIVAYDLVTYLRDNIKNAILHEIAEGKHNLHIVGHVAEFNAVVEEFILRGDAGIKMDRQP